MNSYSGSSTQSAEKQAVRLGPWKGVRTETMSDPDGPIELFHIVDDIAEENDVASRHPEVVAEIQKIMEREQTDAVDRPSGK